MVAGERCQCLLHLRCNVRVGAFNCITARRFKPFDQQRKPATVEWIAAGVGQDGDTAGSVNGVDGTLQ